MTVLCLKASARFPQFTVDDSDSGHYFRTCVPNGMERYYGAHVVLFDTACNRFTFISRDSETGEMEFSSLTGNRRGRMLCERLGHLE